jgi:FtsP/CotA-like multicopper oxidase with cupredoxin domain
MGPMPLLDRRDALVGTASNRLEITRARAAPDGYEREVIHVNGQLPGPVVRGRRDEPIDLEVVNRTDRGVTVHSHGQSQVGTWRFDGVPGVTQAPIPPGETWHARYTADPGGTFWYHSHQMAGNVYPDGLFGPLIVDDPEVDEALRFDRDEILVVNSWEHRTGDELLADLMDPAAGPADDSAPGIPWVTALVNGRGRYPGGPAVPLTTVEVERDVPVRLRIINTSGSFDLTFSIDDHLLQIVTVDGQPVQPVTVASLTVEIGGRYDVIVTPSGDGTHWIRVGNGNTGNLGPADPYAGLAILRYRGSATAEPERSPAQLRLPQLDPRQLRSIRPANLDDDGVTTMPLLLTGSMRPFVWTIDNQVFPDADPLLVSEGDDVRMILANPSMMNHPMHLHGHQFWVLGDPANPNLVDPPRRDVVTVPRGAAMAVQFRADNPGRWMFHCHIDPHMVAGMARLVDYRGFAGQPDESFGAPMSHQMTT